MCGLVGMAGNLLKADRDMFNQMLIVDAIRGHHSTGVASVTDKGRTNLIKKAVSPVDLIQNRQYENVMVWDSQVLIGHNRYATVGRIDNQSAHPFEFPGIVGAHNGTLTGWRAALKDERDFDVDSECLIHNINKVGWDETIRKVTGAIALTVYHEDTHSLCLYRNKERPLYFGYKEDQSVVYWASEAWMIRNMAARSGIKLDKQILSLKENHLVSFKLPKQKVQRLDNPHVRRLEVAPEKKHVPQVTHQPARQAAGTCGQSGASNSSGSINNRSLDGYVYGDVVDFVPTSCENSSYSGQKFIEGVLTRSPWTTVRVYFPKAGKATTKRMTALLDCGRELSAKVVGIAPPTNRGEDGYLVLQASTIKEGIITGKHDGREDQPEVVITETPGPYGKMLNREEFEALAKDGCGNCSCDVEFGETLFWFNNTPVCAECWEDI